jgi:hypothetical protein
MFKLFSIFALMEFLTPKAVPGGTFQTFQAVGNREDLSDIINDISPTETPFYSKAKKGTASATFHEWQTDALDAAATNAAIQGNDAVVNTATPTVRLRNYCQILTKTVSVSGTQDAVNKAGRASELAYQMSKRSKELKRDVEYALVRNQASTSGAAGSGATLAGVESWLATNKTSVGTGTAQTTPGYSGGTVASPTDSSVAGTVTEANLKAVIQACWTQGGDPGVLMVGPATKSKISGSFSGIATRYREVPGMKQGSIVSGVDLYISDFGEHEIVPNRFMRDQNILVLDMDYWTVASLRGFQAFDLAKTGDSNKKQILTELTLVSNNEKASGKVVDINPAL